VKLKYLLVVGAMAVMSCSDSTSPSGASGAVSFSYSGAGVSGTGSYSATGALPANNAAAFGSSAWAAGENVFSSGELDVIGVQPRTASTWDIAGLTIGRNTVGSSSIDPNCVSSNFCTDVTIAFGSNAAEDAYSFYCSLTSGTVTITSITDTRAAGTFSGSGTCQTSASSAETAFTITSGSFDVALTSNVF
jgi:hypothetical protein